MTDHSNIKADHEDDRKTWRAVVAEYQKPNPLRASWQLINTVGSYLGVWVLIYFALQISWWLVLPLALLASGLLVRTFIIFHDCGHGSFFKSSLANDIWGFITGLLTFTPYYQWRWEHAVHHATSGNLDKRGMGDVWTMTVQEYLESTRWKRFSYRLARNPMILFFVAPIFLFVLRQRFPSPKASQKERESVWWMNFALLIVAVIMSYIFGTFSYFLIQLTIMAIAGSVGVWLFYVQHQFEDVYWERGENWDFMKAGIQGSSFYQLPKVLQWFSGNIGFHHIHHLSPRIPNYNLQRCHEADPIFRDVKPLTFFASFKSLQHRLWDETSKKLVGYRHLKSIRKQRHKY